MLTSKTARKISEILFKISPRLQAVVSRIYGWTRKYDLIDAWLRRRYVKSTHDYWMREGGIGPLEDATQRTQLLRETIKALAVKNVLEIGCGYGAVLRAVIQDESLSLSYLTGCDFSTTRLENARSFIANDKVELAVADITKRLPWPDNVFDLSFSESVLQHISPEELDRCLSEIVRVTDKFVIHEEATVPGSIIFVHHYSSWYRKHGHNIAYIARDWEPFKRNRQFLLIELNKSI